MQEAGLETPDAAFFSGLPRGRLAGGVALGRATLGCFFGNEAVQGAKAEEVTASFRVHPRGCLSVGEAEKGDTAFRGRPRGLLTTGKAEDGDLAFRGRPRGRLAAGEAEEGDTAFRGHPRRRFTTDKAEDSDLAFRGGSWPPARPWRCPSTSVRDRAAAWSAPTVARPLSDRPSAR